MSRNEAWTSRGSNPRTMAVVAQAMAERFTIDLCPCGGPRIYSKVTPFAKCFGCGVKTELKTVKVQDRRVRCDTCKKFFYAKLLFKNCPKCGDKKAKQAKIKAKWGGDTPTSSISLKKGERPQNRPVIIEDNDA
jgi:hypothetical protein